MVKYGLEWEDAAYNLRGILLISISIYFYHHLTLLFKTCNAIFKNFAACSSHLFCSHIIMQISQ